MPIVFPCCPFLLHYLFNNCPNLQFYDLSWLLSSPCIVEYCSSTVGDLILWLLDRDKTSVLNILYLNKCINSKYPACKSGNVALRNSFWKVVFNQSLKNSERSSLHRGHDLQWCPQLVVGESGEKKASVRIYQPRRREQSKNFSIF